MRLKVLMESSRSISLDREVIINSISRDCKDALKNYRKGKMIFRGNSNTESNPYLFIQPSKYVRMSANTNNLYTLIIDSSKLWFGYPKRSKSVICSSDLGYADAYGEPYIVFPKDGYKVGVCPSSDIWSSFFKSGIDGMDEFNLKFEDFVHDITGIALASSLSNIESLKKVLALVDTMIATKGVKNIKMFRYIKEYKGSILSSLESILDPKKNGFKLFTSIGSVPDKREIWTDSDCYMVSSVLAMREKFML